MFNNKDIINRKKKPLIWMGGYILLAISPLSSSLPLNDSYIHNDALNNQARFTSEEQAQTFSRDQLFQLDVNESTEFYIGRKNMHYSSLIYSQNYNQGIAGTINLPDFNTELKTFASDTNLQANTNNIDQVGIEDQHNRASGIIWEYRPKKFKKRQMLVTTSYLSGQNSIDNTSGDAISIRTEARGLNNTIHLRSEYAESTFQNSKVSDSSNDTHQAQHYLISYTPHTKTSHKQNNAIWKFGLEKKTIDANFQTVFNRHLPKDKDITRVFGSYNKSQWTSEASFTYEKNNLHKKLSNTENISNFHLISRYRFNTNKVKKPITAFLGNQEYALQYRQANKDQTFNWLNSDDVFESTFNHNQHQTVIFESKSRYNSWHWFYKLAHTKASDKLDINGDFYSNEIELGSQFSLADNTQIETKVRSLSRKKIISDLTSNEVHYKLKLNRALEPVNTSGRLEINYHERNTQLSTDLNEQHTIVSLSGDISRRLFEPKGIYPGMDLSLSADYKQEKNDVAGIDYEDYKTQMNVFINW